MKRSQAFPSKYLSKDDITHPIIATVSAVVIETLTSDDEEKNKSVMYFDSGIDKPMIINVSNWITMEDLYGEDSDDWIGKPIEVWVDPTVMYGGKRIGGLRLRKPALMPKPQTTPQKFNMARLVFDVMTPTEWHEQAAQFCAQNPNWQKPDGKPDLNHVLASAGKAGYETITADNISDVFDAIIGLHAQTAQA